MSIIKQGPMKGTSGKVDDLQLVYKTLRDGTTYAAKLPVKPEVPVRYLKQMEQRTQVGSISNCYAPSAGSSIIPMKNCAWGATCATSS